MNTRLSDRTLSFRPHMALRWAAYTLVALAAVTRASASETVLHAFQPYLRGAYPQANLCIGPGSQLDGTAYAGGSSNAGVVFRVDNASHEALLYNFAGGADGAFPAGALLCNSAGNVYGTTGGGGASGAGTVFRLDGAGHESVLYSFTGGADQ